MESNNSIGNSRKRLDDIFMLDAGFSMLFGVITLVAPHSSIAYMSGGAYYQSTHEALRLYACLRIAVGWILLKLRNVDDGRFRRCVCEGLLLCYGLQALVVLRAQFTDRHTLINWLAISIFISIGTCYAWFRFGSQGNLIKVYELPSSSERNIR